MAWKIVVPLGLLKYVWYIDRCNRLLRVQFLNLCPYESLFRYRMLSYGLGEHAPIPERINFVYND